MSLYRWKKRLRMQEPSTAISPNELLNVVYHTRDVPYVERTARSPDPYRHDVPANPRGEDFARLIRTARDARGWTQEALEAATGVSRSTIARWEAGHSTTPDPDNVRAVCKALGIDPRRAAVALGYLTEDDIRPPDAGRLSLDPTIEEVVAILEDPHVPDADKKSWVAYLRYLRGIHERPAAG